MSELTIVNVLLTAVNVGILGIGIKLYSEMVKWRVLEKRH